MDRQYDVSPEELDRMRRRFQIREQLRKEFNRKTYNPYNMAYRLQVMDPAVARFMSARVSYYDYWKPTWKSFFCWFGTMIAPIIITSIVAKRYRDEFERKCSHGEITYEQRKRKLLI